MLSNIASETFDDFCKDRFQYANMQKDDKKALGERIRQVRGEMSREEFGAPLGCSGQAVSQWEVGKTSPSSARLTKIATVYGVDYNWLISGKGSMRGLGQIKTVPLIGWVSAGTWAEAVEHATDFVQGSQRGGPNCFALRVEGESMNRITPAGEIIIVDPDNRDLIDGKFYVIQNGDGEACFKRFRATGGPARFEPFSFEEGHTTYYLGHAHVEIIGRVIWRGADM